VGSVCYYLGVAALLVGAVCRPVRGQAPPAQSSGKKGGQQRLRLLRPPSALERRRLIHRLRSPDDLLGVLANQCVTMAKISWTKHRLVQISMLSGAFGILLLVVTGIYLA
jgi:hypothetical protein